MGKPNLNDGDLAASLITAAFIATGRSGSFRFNPGLVNVSVWGTFTGTVRLEKSYDGGATWFPFQTDLSGTALSFTGAGAYERHIQLQEAESGILYSWNCTAFTSGTINCRASQG